MAEAIAFAARVLRKEDFLPRYVVVRPEHVPGRKATFAAEVTLNGAGPFRRNIRPWGKGSDVFFFNLTQVQCDRAGLATNDPVEVVITPLEGGEGA